MQDEDQGWCYRWWCLQAGAASSSVTTFCRKKPAGDVKLQSNKGFQFEPQLQTRR